MTIAKRLILALLLVVAALPAGGVARARLQPVTSTLGSSRAEPSGDGGTPIDQPVGTTTGEESAAMPEIDTAKAIVQLGAIGMLAVVLFFYRRDFLKKIDGNAGEKDQQLRDRKEEKEQLADLVEKNTAALTNTAVTMARQTDATHRLARTVENIERRQAGLPPSGRESGS